jgi:SpoVK/Ycf46/Vps4 family AAA+-type ATPase
VLQIERVEDLVILPLTKPHLFSKSKLANRPTGVLLYGPPGTGKTLLAKAIAKECGASFINVNLATIMSKYVGDSEKMVQAVFSLAHKLSPCIVFVDEMDGFLSRRTEGSNDPAVTDKVKTLFMSLWDGIATASTQTGVNSESGEPEKAWVLVIGATNRPHALDTAILRRMPRQIQVGLPSAVGREKILRVLLKGEAIAPPGKAAHQLDLSAVAVATHQYSGSDLKELCRAAALRPIREASIAERSTMRTAREGVEVEFARKVQERADWECGMAPSSAPPSPSSDAAQAKPSPPNADSTAPMSETEAGSWREQALEAAQVHAANTVHMRPIVTGDLIAAMAEVKQTGLSAYEYQQTLAAAQTGLGDGSVPVFAPAGAAFGGGLEGNSARLLGALQQQTQKGV